MIDESPGGGKMRREVLIGTRTRRIGARSDEKRIKAEVFAAMPSANGRGTSRRMTRLCIK
jgi:hypothetical protein